MAGEAAVKLGARGTVWFWDEDDIPQGCGSAVFYEAEVRTAF